MRVTVPFLILGISSERGANNSSSVKPSGSIKLAIQTVPAVLSDPGISESQAVSHKDELQNSDPADSRNESNFQDLMLLLNRRYRLFFLRKDLSSCNSCCKSNQIPLENYSLQMPRVQSSLNDPNSSIWTFISQQLAVHQLN